MQKSGFTLLELSIVLVIIGLITGGVIVGSSLVRQAEIKSVAKDLQAISTALHTFILKYQSLPGDMPNALSYWPGVTANGDGNSVIGDPAAIWVWQTEGLRAWQQLSLARIIPGNYTGVLNGTSATIGVNVQGSQALSAGYLFRYDDGTGENFGKKGNFLSVAGEMPDGSFWRKVMKPEEAFQIDIKLDDGKYNTGRLIGTTGAQFIEDCIDYGAGSYNLVATDNSCRLAFFF